MTNVPRLFGRAAALPLGALARYRRGKPMHPRGAAFSAVLERRGCSEPVGLPWFDAVADDRAIARLSRGAGLPAPIPDLLGLAVRVHSSDGESIDLLLSSAGLGRLTRLVPVPRIDAATTYSSIMGYRSDAGTLRLAARADVARLSSEPDAQAAAVAGGAPAFTLAVARGLGPWRAFARLVLTEPLESLDPDLRFDAVRHPPPGLVADGPMARFRAPAYAAARRGRDEGSPPA